jgi:hypothetical protein
MLSWFRALMPREERPMEYSAGIALDQSTLDASRPDDGPPLVNLGPAHERRSAVATGYPVNSKGYGTFTDRRDYCCVPEFSHDASWRN